MTRSTKQTDTITIGVRSKTKEKFEEIFEESGANSKGEFLNILLDNYTDPDNVIEKEKIVEVEKKVEVPVEKEIRVEVPIPLKENDILIELTPIHFEILKVIAEHEEMIPLFKEFFNGRENFTDRLFVDVNETDDLKTKIGKVLINVLISIEIYGPHDGLPGALTKAKLRELISKHYPELESQN